MSRTSTLPPPSESEGAQPELFDPEECDFQDRLKQRCHPNPMVRQLGFGPEGATCKTCANLIIRRFGKTYYKCGLRPLTKGEGTDIRVGWDACQRYEADPPADATSATEATEGRETPVPWWHEK